MTLLEDCGRDLKDAEACGRWWKLIIISVFPPCPSVGPRALQLWVGEREPGLTASVTSTCSYTFVLSTPSRSYLLDLAMYTFLSQAILAGPCTVGHCGQANAREAFEGDSLPG